jgi:succinyl-CoA synthetase alpha subunit
MSKREKQYTTKTGYVITEEMLEKIGSDCQKGIYPGESGRIIKKNPVPNTFGKSSEKSLKDNQ